METRHDADDHRLKSGLSKRDLESRLEKDTVSGCGNKSIVQLSKTVSGLKLLATEQTARPTMYEVF
ncbi:hypothetical protein Pla100_37140 [Neorhodopirellula pilleata]|uniref:Uncharacterized protein n=1 Tax=Neorhodopirellula pilleata TaxID=2714738 RepID=A0A5C6A6V8_9BACT|nr:hypothetical protein Pla100_37140 [Neorhodopirellula pilleata]